MARTAKAVIVDETARQKLEKIVNSQRQELRIVRRAKIIIACIDGKRIIDIAKELNEQIDVIIKWRDRFVKFGIPGLSDKQRTGKPVKYDKEWKSRVLQKLNEKPPAGLVRWDGPTLAKELCTSPDAIQRFMQKEGIQLARLRTWCVSTDPEFTPKSADIVGLYLQPPENAIVICVDEKPSIQALSRSTGVIKLSNKKIVSAIKSTYKRNGTQNLFAALNVMTGKVFGKPTKTKKRADFLSYMDDLLIEWPIKEGTNMHVILDNYCIHKRCEEWLATHPYVKFHYTPTSASWLNQVEIWFGIMSRKVLRGASFNNIDELVTAIKLFIDQYNATSEPFVWKKREVRGSQIKDNLSNICV